MAVQDVKGIVNAMQFVSGKVNVVPSGGGSDPVIQPKTITENGTYEATDAVDGYAPVTVNVPTGTARSSTDVTVAGRTVTIPAGLYSSVVKKNVDSGLVENPTATKGISGTTATFSPSVTIHEGYVLGTTKLGQPQTVTAAELDTLGTKSITENGTGIDVVGYSAVNVNVSGGGMQWNTISGTTIGSTNLTFSGVDLTNASVVIIDFVCRDKTGGTTNIFAGTVRLFSNSMISSDLLQALTEKTTASGTEYIHNINSKEMTAFSRFMLFGYGGGNVYGNSPITIAITSDSINIKLSYQLLTQSIYDVNIKWL